MNQPIYRIGIVSALCASLFAGGCAMTPEGNALAGAAAAAVGTLIVTNQTDMDRKERAAAAAGAAAAVGALVYVISKREASVSQRQIAAQRARTYQQNVNRGATRPPRERYVAIDAPADTRTQGSRNVMIWDTKSQEIVGNNVYDLKEPPRRGSVANFESYSAEYVGTGY